jgi:predicted phage terminase large subunit-like protein
MFQLTEKVLTLEQQMVSLFKDRLKRAIDGGDSESFRQYLSRVNPRYQWYIHNVILARKLQRVADGEIKRLMIFEPPRHGKTETSGRSFPAYFLDKNPDKWVGLASYGASLAVSIARAARDNFIRGGGQINPAVRAASHWETIQGGGMWATGVGGSATGKGGHLLIIDDPLKDRKQANSEVERTNQKDWLDAVFNTRLEPDGALILQMTRWHPDDLAGYIISKQEYAEEQWHVVFFPAMFEGERPTIFPDNFILEDDFRTEVDQALCPERYPEERLVEIRDGMSKFNWAALYQQRPVPKEGGMFRRSWFEIVDNVPTIGFRIRWWDRAATHDGGDYTVGALLLYDPHADLFFVEDIVRGQWASGERDRIIKQTAIFDRDRYGLEVKQWVEQEPGSSGVDAAKAFIRLLLGFPAKYEPSTGSKEDAADPLASMAQIGRVKLRKAHWNKEALDEIEGFPFGPNDDIVDAISKAFNKLARKRARSVDPDDYPGEKK